MNLLQLAPRYIRYTSPGRHQEANDLRSAHGISFMCPKCYAATGASAHSIVLWFANKGVPDSEGPFTERWKVIGGINHTNLSVGPMITLSTGCKWRGSISAGMILHIADPAQLDHKLVSVAIQKEREVKREKIRLDDEVKLQRERDRKKHAKESKEPKDPKDPKDKDDKDKKIETVMTEDKAESKTEPKAEPAVEPQVDEPKAEPKVEPKIEPVVEPKVEPKVDNTDKTPKKPK